MKLCRFAYHNNNIKQQNMQYRSLSSNNEEQQGFCQLENKEIQLIPKIVFPAIPAFKHDRQRQQSKVHSLEQEVTFRKKRTPKRQQPQTPFIEAIQKQQQNSWGHKDENWMNEQNAKSQLLDVAEELRRREASNSSQMTEQREKSHYNDGGICGFTMRQLGHIKKLIASKTSNNQGLPQDKVRKAVLNGLSSENLLFKKRKSTGLSHLKQQETPKVHWQEQETVELGEGAFMKYKCILMDDVSTQKNTKSLSTAEIRNHLEKSRSKKTKQSHQSLLEQKAQYGTLMKQLENMEGPNTMFVTNQQDKKAKKQNKLSNANKKRIKYLNSRAKTSADQHEEGNYTTNFADGFTIKRYSTIEALQKRPQKQLLLKKMENRKRSLSTASNTKELQNAKKYKMLGIFSKMRRSMLQNEQQNRHTIEPMSCSIPLSINNKSPSPEKPCHSLQKSKCCDSALKLVQDRPKLEPKNIINSIKLFSESRKSRNITQILAKQQNRFKTTLLLKQMSAVQ